MCPVLRNCKGGTVAHVPKNFSDFYFFPNYQLRGKRIKVGIERVECGGKAHVFQYEVFPIAAGPWVLVDIGNPASHCGENAVERFSSGASLDREQVDSLVEFISIVSHATIGT